MSPQSIEEDVTENSRGVAAVERALTILDAFRTGESSLSLARLAERTKLYKSTILRLIVSLEAFGYIRRLPAGDYQLGPKLSELGNMYLASFQLDTFVLPVLRHIVQATRESASFYVRDGDRRVVLYRVDAPQAVRDSIRAGDTLPLHKGAGGKVLIRFEEGAASLSRYRATDFVIATFGERQADTGAVAAPVFGTRGNLVGAIGVSGPLSRFDHAAVTAMSPTIFGAAAALSVQLGASPTIFPEWPGSGT